MSNYRKEYFVKLKNGSKLFLEESIQLDSGELTLQRFNHGIEVGNRTSIINHLIKKFDYQTYLEIGVRAGINFEKIIIKNKIGIDPKPISKNFENIIQTTSDYFFRDYNYKFDIIFIDGLHLEKQVDKDIKNSLKKINENGTIILHDCNPPTKFHQREQYEVNGKFPAWNGTTWKSFVKLRNEKNLKMFCVDCDWGVGIIRRGNQSIYLNKNEFNYDDLEKNRNKILNLISVKDFLKKFR